MDTLLTKATELKNIEKKFVSKVPAPFTAEPSPASKNFCLQGREAEKWVSEHLPKNAPLLISAKLCKKWKIKQVDLAQVGHYQVTLWEVKYSKVGEAMALQRALTFKDKRKWLRTRAFLSVVFLCQITIKVAVVLKNDGNFFVKDHILV